MSDVPDWLVELAAQGNDDDREDDERDDDVFDFASSEPLNFSPEPEPGETMFEATQAAVETEAQAPETDADPMDALRSQVEAEDLEDGIGVAKPKRGLSLRLPGLLPWQQFVLALLLLLDVIVIGLLFLVMLGRVSIG
ncbi:MAG: hypothetical protein MUQ30_09140 [Anaerolineae bacterium]|nr:hypothetical protein [Anaerolineae bacterium]